jgi:hypothetical protein
MHITKLEQSTFLRYLWLCLLWSIFSSYKRPIKAQKRDEEKMSFCQCLVMAGSKIDKTLDSKRLINCCKLVQFVNEKEKLSQLLTHQSFVIEIGFPSHLQNAVS